MQRVGYIQALKNTYLSIYSREKVQWQQQGRNKARSGLPHLEHKCGNPSYKSLILREDDGRNERFAKSCDNAA